MTISQATKFLEGAFDVLNKEYFENTLSKPLITIQSTPGTFGHYTTYDAWTAPGRARASEKSTWEPKAWTAPRPTS